MQFRQKIFRPVSETDKGITRRRHTFFKTPGKPYSEHRTGTGEPVCSARAGYPLNVDFLGIDEPVEDSVDCESRR